MAGREDLKVEGSRRRAMVNGKVGAVGEAVSSLAELLCK